MVARLILAGLIADFVLQPGSLVAWKQRSVWGLLVHVAAVFATSLLIGVGAWSSRYAFLVLAVTTAHFVIDLAKIAADRRWTEGLQPLATFLADQGLHAVSILLLAAVFGYVSASELIT